MLKLTYEIGYGISTNLYSAASNEWKSGVTVGSAATAASLRRSGAHVTFSTRFPSNANLQSITAASLRTGIVQAQQSTNSIITIPSESGMVMTEPVVTRPSAGQSPFPMVMETSNDSSGMVGVIVGIVAGIAVVLVGVGAALFYFVTPKSAKQSTEPSVATAAPEQSTESGAELPPTYANVDVPAGASFMKNGKWHDTEGYEIPANQTAGTVVLAIETGADIATEPIAEGNAMPTNQPAVIVHTLTTEDCTESIPEEALPTMGDPSPKCESSFAN